MEILLNQVETQVEWILRILIAALLGAAIGCERKNRNKMAGVRTHAIVALGAALMMIVSKYGFDDVSKFDASRVAAQIVSGVGFLGAGIIFQKDNVSVSGLTTAAGVWATAGVGMCTGSGLYFLAVISALMIVLVQVTLHKISFLSNDPYENLLRITLRDISDVVNSIEKDAMNQNIVISEIEIKKENQEDTTLDLKVVFPAGYNKIEFINQLSRKENVISVKG